jgi:hypothetical protein
MRDCYGDYLRLFTMQNTSFQTKAPRWFIHFQCLQGQKKLPARDTIFWGGGEMFRPPAFSAQGVLLPASVQTLLVELRVWRAKP